jgi:myo-inositol-1(or 4)-monophosphatase
MTEDINELLRTCEDAARAGGSELLAWRGRFGFREKGATDFVTDADLASQEAVRRVVSARFPEHEFIGEERAPEEMPQSADAMTWVVDPLDGTTNFLYGFPQWAVSIALEGELGVVFDPIRDELFSAVTGSGALLNGVPIRIPPPPALSTALIATGFAYDAERRDKQGAVIGRVLPRIRDIRRAGAAALDLCWLAAGRLDGYYERGLHAWDWAAARIVVQEAGGAVADLEADPHGLAAAHPSLLPELLDLLADAESGVF